MSGLQGGIFPQKKSIMRIRLKLPDRLKIMELNTFIWSILTEQRKKSVVNYKILEKIAAGTSLKIDFGGGIRSDDDLDIVFSSGARQVTCGSIAVTSQTLVLEWLSKWGQEKIMLGADSLTVKYLQEDGLKTLIRI